MKYSSKAFLALTIVLALFVFGCVGQNSKTLYASMGRELSQSQFFTLNDLNGKEVNLKDELKSHKAVLVNFFATWCPPCREEIPDLIKLQEKFKTKSFTVLAVNVNESQQKVSNFVEKMGINYSVVLDVDNIISQEYRVVGIPTSYLLKSDGKILGEYHAAGPDLFEDVKKALS